MIQKITEKVWVIKVPDAAEKFEISIQDDSIPCLTYWYKDNLEPTVICLEPGNWEYLCTTIGVTERDAAKILRRKFVNSYPDLYFLYPIEELNDRLTSDWRKALDSLLKSKNLTGNYALLINQNK